MTGWRFARFVGAHGRFKCSGMSWKENFYNLIQEILKTKMCYILIKKDFYEKQRQPFSIQYKIIEDRIVEVFITFIFFKLIESTKFLRIIILFINNVYNCSYLIFYLLSLHSYKSRGSQNWWSSQNKIQKFKNIQIHLTSINKTDWYINLFFMNVWN